jgi:hypothetical protein
VEELDESGYGNGMRKGEEGCEVEAEIHKMELGFHRTGKGEQANRIEQY